MEHVGIDLGATHSHVVIVSEGRTTRHRVRTAEIGSWLRSRSPARVVMEACTQSRAVAQLAIAAQHQTVVVPSHLVRALGVGARGIKTDDRDAEVLALALSRNMALPSVHLRSALSVSRMGLLSARASLVGQRKALVNHVRGWLRSHLVVLKGRAQPGTFVRIVREAALQLEIGLPMELDLLLEHFEMLSLQIAKLTAEVERLASEDELCRRLMTIPGVGPILSLAFAAQLDTASRFGSSNQVASYLALVPGEATTGGRIFRTRTIRSGPTYLKALLVQSAWSMWRTRPNDPLMLWTRAVSERRGKRVAVLAAARKIATVMWSMWKHGSSYDPGRASSRRMQPRDSEAAATQGVGAPATRLTQTTEIRSS